MAEQFARPFAITAHAVQRYRERVDPGASRQDAIVELQRALQAPAFERAAPRRPGATLYGCRDRLGRRIGIIVAPAPEPGMWPVVVTVGGWLLWQEAKPEWEAMYREYGAERRAEAAPVPAPEPVPEPATVLRRLSTQQRRRAAGVCIRCGQAAPAPGRTSCAPCLVRYAAQQATRRTERGSRGACPRCGRPAEGQRRCAECRAAERLRERHPAKAATTPTPYRQAQIDLIARYSGRRSVTWLAEHLRVKPRTVVNLIEREGLGPTERDDLLTTTLAGEMLSYSAQWVSTLCRRGVLRGWRNPTSAGRETQRRWWLVPRSEVQRLLGLLGRQSDDVRLTEPSGWPQVRLRRGRMR